MASAPFTGVKVFSTTLARDRETMGETITKWLRDNPGLEVVRRYRERLVPLVRTLNCSRFE